mgnify:CR=1 FL=1
MVAVSLKKKKKIKSITNKSNQRQKYKRENLKGMFRHNERRNRNYSNNNIDKEKSYLNYSLKEPQYSYENKKGRIKYVN